MELCWKDRLVIGLVRSYLCGQDVVGSSMGWYSPVFRGVRCCLWVVSMRLDGGGLDGLFSVYGFLGGLVSVDLCL